MCTFVLSSVYLSSNVAPEYGVMETRAYLELARLEKKLQEIGVIDEVITLYFLSHGGTIKHCA